MAYTIGRKKMVNWRVWTKTKKLSFSSGMNNWVGVWSFIFKSSFSILFSSLQTKKHRIKNWTYSTFTVNRKKSKAAYIKLTRNTAEIYHLKMKWGILKPKPLKRTNWTGRVKWIGSSTWENKGRKNEPQMRGSKVP